MVFRKDNNKVDAFQRQISALRHQLGGTGDEDAGHEAYRDDEAQFRPADPEGDAASGGETVDDTPRRREDRYRSEDDPTPEHRFAPVAGVPEPEPPVLPTLPVAADARTSVIAHDTSWKGDLTSDGTVHVHGRVEGGVTAKDDVYVAEEAEVDATITATNVIVAGLVRGSVRCSDRFEVLPQGRVQGDAIAPTLVVHHGATVSGQVRMTPESPGELQPPAPTQRRAGRGSARA
jgi:cytoskeletal protein CcmA (bactofilin family)